jgi:ketosteroid isomerase-like protein
MGRIGLVLIAVAFASVPSSVGQDAAQSRIFTLENAWNQAVIVKDAKAIESLLASELVFITYEGTVMNKAAYLENVKGISVHFEHVESETMQVFVYRQSAVVTGLYRESGTKSGKPFSRRERFIDTWINRGNTWLCVASQSTLITH